jgi:uncharacterized protein
MSPRTTLVALASGLLFGVGLAVSGLTHPQVVLGFLDVTGAWDPTLAVVMLVATVTNAVFVALATRRRRPVCAGAFALPATGTIDGRLIAGAAIFGVGWGLAGVCPGPALASLASGEAPAFVFVAAMTCGLLAVERRNRQPVEFRPARSSHGGEPGWTGSPTPRSDR